MTQSYSTNIVTLVATPPADAKATNDDPFIRAALETIASKKSTRNQVIRVASVRDIDLELSRIFSSPAKTQIRVQIIGHSLSGGLALGARWIPDSALQAKAYQFPHYVLDTNPAALGLLSKHAGKMLELMLVGCSIASARSFGYPINGRTLMYTLAELLRCDVLGADDVIGPDEFDEHGWYAPRGHRSGPKGWRWVENAPPMWIEARTEAPSRRRIRVA
jgi:hypothetical protein